MSRIQNKNVKITPENTTNLCSTIYTHSILVKM